MEKKRVVFTGGGTGGHVYPNIAIYEELREKYPGSSFLYIGTKKGAEKRIVRNISHPIEFIDVRSKGIPQKIKSVGTLVSLFFIFLGVVKSFFLLRKFKPDIIIGSGGYVAAPVLIAASFLKLKVFIHEQNAVPGRLNRFISRFAAKIGVSFASTANFFPEEKVVFTGYPLRRSIKYSRNTNIKEKYGIPEKNKVIFIFGGSGGARTINTAVAELIPVFLSMKNLTVILSTGRGYSKEYKAFDDTIKIFRDIGVPPEVEGKLLVKEYFDNIDEIYAISDLVVSRAGAGTIKEITTLGIPSILIPKIDLPGDHQILNAREVEKAGGARIVYEEVRYRDNRRTIYVPETTLLSVIREALYDSDMLFNMRKNLRKIEKQNSSELILKEIEQIFRGKEKADEQQIKVFYLHSLESEKNIELIFNSTYIGSSVLCDLYLDDVEDDVLIDLRLIKDGEKIIVRKKKGSAALNGEEVTKWAEINEDDRLEIGEKTFVLKSYFEKVKKVHIEKTTSSKILGSSFGILISRLSGLFRYIVIAAYFGAGRVVDIYAVGLTIAHFMRRILAEHALESAFLPIFSRLFHRSSRKRTWEAASSITNFTLLLSLLFTVSGILLAPVIIKTIFYPFLAKGMIQDTINMTRLLLPYLFLVTFASVITTYLKAFNRFGVAESSSIFFSLGAIIGIVALHSTAGLFSIAYGILFGGFMQIIFLYPFIARIFKNKTIGFSYKPVIEFTGAAAKKYYSQLLPLSLDVIMARINEVVSLFLASGLKTGCIAFLSFALTIFRYPFAMISRAINSLVLKEFSDKVAFFDKKKTRRLFIDGLKANIFLLTPIAILMIVLAEPIVSLIFERGRFDSSQVSATAYALQFYALGLVGWGIHSFTVKIFSARINVRTSLWLNFMMLLTNIGLSYFLVKTSLGYAGLALATSISFLIFALVRIVVLKTKLEDEEILIKYREVSLSFFKTLFSAFLMVIGLVQAKFIFKGIDFSSSKVVGNIVLLISLSFIGISIYFLSSLMLKNAQVLIFRKKILNNANKIPISMLSPFKFFEKVSQESDKFRDDYYYKINIYISSLSWEIRNVGIKLVGLFKDKSKAGYLIDILRSGTENGFVRRNALNSLNRLNTWNPEVKQLVVALLDDPYYEVRAGALDLLYHHSSVKDYNDYKNIIRKRFKKFSLEEKLAGLRLAAKIGSKEDVDYFVEFSLDSNSLIREELLKLIYGFYRRKLLTVEEVKEYIGGVLITSNNLNPEFELKSIIKKIYKEIEKG
ncbi:MAG: murein biosynthesis integral membrane protein MurJ [Candidatus Aminicenantes bacterium]|nr:murein biosynthesis integral membrane protein MurJ [Candidatus Aminicenantes bacterium]